MRSHAVQASGATHLPQSPHWAGLEPPVSPGQHQEMPTPESDVQPAHTQHTGGLVLAKPSC